MRNYCNFSLSSLLFSLKQLLLPSPFPSTEQNHETGVDLFIPVCFSRTGN